MTEFERATIAFQEATLAYQESTLAFQESTLAIQEAGLAYQAAALGWTAPAIAAAVTSAVSALAALAAAAGIWYGIRAMVRANRERAVILDQQRQADERRHEETMAALNELIRASQAQSAALERQGVALETLIERTAPKE